MKTITIDDKLYAFIASQTKHIGESASDILRRILMEDHGLVEGETENVDVKQPATVSKEVDDINVVKGGRNDAHATAKALNGESVVNAAGVFTLLGKQKLAEHKSKVGRFLMILAALNKAHTDTFEKVLEIKGKDRLYFAKSEASLLSTGSSTNPKQIPDSNFWVVTNNNTAKKQAMLQKAAKALGYSESNIKKITDLFTL